MFVIHKEDAFHFTLYADRTLAEFFTIKMRSLAMAVSEIPDTTTYATQLKNLPKESVLCLINVSCNYFCGRKTVTWVKRSLMGKVLWSI